MVTAVYAGSFDPLTNGHLWVAERGAKMFDRVIVALGLNPEKQTMFDEAERLQMNRESLAHLPNVTVDSFPFAFLVDYAVSVRADVILRGVRNPKDWEYEEWMREVNGEFAPDITTVYISPPIALRKVSSSLVKQLIGPAGWDREDRVGCYVPAPVLAKLKERHDARTRTLV